MVVLCLAVMGCGKRTEMRLKLRQAEAVLAERSAAYKTIQGTAVSLPPKFASATQRQVDELTAKLKAADEELSRLKADRDATAETNADMRRQIDEYVAKFTKP